MSPGSVRWKWQDISNAICLHAAGPRAYNHMYKQGYPLPHVSTLQRWCQKVDLSEGILYTTINYMREATDLTPDQKLTVLCFDEMKVMETYEYDASLDMVRKPAKYVQVVMASGLKTSWKQPIFYGFDSKVKKELLEKIICLLYDAGFLVVAIICDLGSSNRNLRSKLGISERKYKTTHWRTHYTHHTAHR